MLFRSSSSESGSGCSGGAGGFVAQDLVDGGLQVWVQVGAAADRAGAGPRGSSGVEERRRGPPVAPTDCGAQERRVAVLRVRLAQGHAGSIVPVVQAAPAQGQAGIRALPAEERGPAQKGSGSSIGCRAGSAAARNWEPDSEAQGTHPVLATGTPGGEEARLTALRPAEARSSLSPSASPAGLSAPDAAGEDRAAPRPGSSDFLAEPGSSLGPPANLPGRPLRGGRPLAQGGEERILVPGAPDGILPSG